MEVEVTHTSADSTLSRIIQLVTEAQEARPKLQRWFDQVSRRYATSIILLATLFALTLPMIIGIPFLGTHGSLYRALAFLIAASPCALIIAIPIAYLSGISVCARRGILLKGGLTLDALASCNAVAFDKTGTLTTGELSLEKVEAENDSPFTIEHALSVAYAMEKNAVHPIAEAITTYAEKLNITASSLKHFKSIPGYGLEATVLLPTGETAAYIGNPEYILPKISNDALKDKIQAIQDQGDLVAILLLGDHPFILQFRDTPRAHIKQTLKALKEKWKLRLVMLTGDHQASAAKIAKEMEIDRFYSNLRPEDKLQYITKYSRKENLAMVGDGVNDAPALARATIGICMGKVGSTPALDAADIVLLHDNLDMLDWLFKKAHQTQAVVKQNLIIATSAILIASIPALAGIVPLWLAVIMHEGGTVLVGLNALRLLRK